MEVVLLVRRYEVDSIGHIILYTIMNVTCMLCTCYVPYYVHIMYGAGYINEVLLRQVLLLLVIM